MLAKGLAHQVVLLHLDDRLAQVGREALHLVARAVFLAQLPHVGVDRGAGIDLVLHPVEPGGQLHGQGEVRIAGRVRHPEFHPRADSAAVRHPDHRRSVALRPRDVHRRLVARHQALVAVHEGVGNRGDGLRVLLEPTDVVAHRVRDLILGVGVEEDVHPILEQRLVRVHAGTVLPVDRLREERGVQVVRQGRVADDEPERGQVVGRSDHIGVLEIDFVLSRGHFVVCGLDLESHGLEVVHDHPPGLLAQVHRREVEVAARIVRDGRRAAFRVTLKQEELGLHSRVHHEAHFRRAGRHALQAQPRVAGERRPVRLVHVADQASDPGIRVPPREHAERLEVGLEEHVALLDAHEALDRGAVEQDLAVERLAKLTGRDLDVLGVAQDVREREAEKADVERATQFENAVGVGIAYRAACRRWRSERPLRARMARRRSCQASCETPATRGVRFQ